MGDTEEYFPRGGKKPTGTYFKQSGNFLGAPEKAEKRKKRPKKKSEADDGYLSDEAARTIDKSYINCAIGIYYNTAKPGLLLLGRVRQIQETKVTVMLPGRMTGYVMACHISEPYNKQLEAYVNDQIDKVSELSQIFRPGQYVALKVLEVSENNLMLSMMPQHVNSGRQHTHLHNGALLQAAVSSVEDHGYVMDIGIANTRAFLPISNINPDIELDVGVITWCCVKSLTPGTESSVVELTAELSALQRGVQRKNTSAPLLPGTAVDFSVNKALKNGIEGIMFGDTTAYVQRYHADTVKGKKPALGQKVRARVLYVMPTRNTPFLTMRNIFETTFPDLDAEQKLKQGDVVNDAQVLKITGRCIHFKLDAGAFGTMSLKRIHVDEDLTDEEVLSKSYPIGSTHKVRVLGYNLCDYMYSVSDEASVLSEKYFSLSHLKVGELVTATVKSVEAGRVVLQVGRVTGIVPQSHLSDAGVYVDPKKASTSKILKKFKVGQDVKARVLVLDEEKGNVLLTLKPTLLSPTLEVLSSYEQAEIGKAYTGVIKFIREYVLVTFFNNVTAYVPRNYVTKEAVPNLNDAFHLGQIVNCTILRVDIETKKMTGSLTTTPFWPEKKREIPDKRKHKPEDAGEVPTKKIKLSSSDDNGAKKNKETDNERADGGGKNDKSEKKKRKDSDTVDNVIKKKKDIKTICNDMGNDVDNSEVKTKPKKKKKRDSGSDTNIAEPEVNSKKSKKKKDSIKVEKKTEVSEESDAIETDIYEDSDQILTPQEQGLIDLSDCTNAKQHKKRVVSLLKAIKARTNRIYKIEKKIARIEEQGLNAKNKKFHTSMHMEKLVVQERTKKMMEALLLAQEKLKNFDLGDSKDYKRKKDKKSASIVDNSVEDESAEVKVENKKTKDKVKKKRKEIIVAESLEPALEVPSAKDFWNGDVGKSSQIVQEQESSSSEDEDKEQPKKKRKKLSVAEKLAKVREEEERVREMERRAIESESAPRSTEQFERALLANPANSQLWIAYMAFYLQATELEKARAVCRKALNTIPFREEQDKLNVWLALINCENRFGTKESQQKTLEEALQMNDPYQIHSKLLDIYVETSKHQELSSLVDLMLRKYKREGSTYTMCGAACFKLGLVDKARQVMQKAMVVLEKKEHVSVLVQFALLERSLGERERAEALFEQILAVYPQRVDVCCTYVDMLIKGGDVEHVRQLLERMTSHKIPARKMKVLYKKWIEVEEKLGDPEQVEKIQKRAVEYIEKAKF